MTDSFKILIADRCNKTRQSLNEKLNSWGYQTVLCENEVEAHIILMQKNCPIIAILDWSIPQGNGVDICRELMLESNKSFHYIILMSTKYKASDMLEGFEAGADDYITKPIDYTLLQCRLKVAYKIIKRQLELEEMNFLIEDVVKKRTHDLQSRTAQLEQEVKAKKSLEAQLDQSLKMEAIGQLAAGIAHEINTPAQYIGDNAHFIKEGIDDLLRIWEKFNTLLVDCKKNDFNMDLILDIEESMQVCDIDYIKERLPKAIERSSDGIKHISSIVRAMKEFSHPGSAEPEPALLNECIESTVIVARNEWKYFAELELHLDENIPIVNCCIGEINQLLLNLIVNAAHAIEEKINSQSIKQKGLIKITTSFDLDCVIISISDTGTGIKEEYRNKIFDPFFTTKEVGRGTGQGLALVFSVVEKHSGTIALDTIVGEGSTFIVKLPIEARMTTQKLKVYAGEQIF